MLSTLRSDAATTESSAGTGIPAMLDRVRSLAQFITLKQSNGEKFVLMLGAGASISSGVKTTDAIIKELAETYGNGRHGTVEDRFDHLWEAASAADRLQMLRPYLDCTPSGGYGRLADLIRRGFFDTIITFNFDRLLELALAAAGVTDAQVIVRGETDPNALDTLVHSKESRIKIIKLHGSLRSAEYFLFSKEEMLNYPREIRELMHELTGRDIIISGYAFRDNCVIRSFNDARESGSIYYVNPSGAGESIKGFLVARRSQDRVISGDLGRFDEFFEALHHQLTTPAVVAAPQQRRNMFKFLDHYQEEHRSWFLGRRRLTRVLVKRLEAPAPTSLFLHGKPKVGKTSCIRAGVIPYLDPARHDCVYLRCKRDLETQLRRVIVARYGQDLATLPWEDALTRVKQRAGKPVVLFLDQFELPARAFDESRDNKKAILDFVSRTLGQSDAQLKIVCIAVDENAFWKLVAQASIPSKDTLEIEALSPARVASIIRRSARRGGIALDARVIEEICNDYRRTQEHPTDKRPFTLTHVQTMCYYLVKGYQNWEGYERVPNQGLLSVLDSIREESSLVDLVDELPIEERRLIRSFLKVICDPATNTRRIVEFIRDHFPEIKEDRFPEPLA